VPFINPQEKVPFINPQEKVSLSTAIFSMVVISQLPTNDLILARCDMFFAWLAINSFSYRSLNLLQQKSKETGS